MKKKTIKHASADVELIFTAYNLKRIFNLIDLNELKLYLKSIALFFDLITAFFKAFCGSFLLFPIPFLFYKYKLIVI